MDDDTLASPPIEYAPQNIVTVNVPRMSYADLMRDAEENERLRQICLDQANGYVLRRSDTPC